MNDNGDPLHGLRQAVGKAPPGQQTAAAVRFITRMAAAGMTDAVRLQARAYIKQHRLIEPLAEFDRITRAAAPASTGAGTHAHLHTPPALASDQDILGKAVQCMRVCMGLTGEQRTAQLTYLAMTSRLLAKPVSAVVKGLSSSGKSFTTECVEALFPAEAKLVMTAMSEHALVYLDDDLAHRTVVLYEAAALRENREQANGDMAAYMVRSLLSEGRLRYPTVVRDGDRLRTVWIEKKGPTNLVTTTTAVSLHAENETRMFSLASDESEAQTAAVLLAECDDEERAGPDLKPWHGLQCWLAQASHDVVLGFDRCVAAQIPPKATRLRRDWRAVRSLIRAHAMLHQLTRDRDGRGRVVATIEEDYTAVYGLVADLVAEGIGATVPATVRQTVQAVAERQKAAEEAQLPGAGFGGVKVAEIAAGLGIERSAAQRRVQAARARDYLVNAEDRRGRPARYVLGEPMPGQLAVLPAPDQVCSTAGPCAHQAHHRRPARSRRSAEA
jgi:hypothetical protein